MLSGDDLSFVGGCVDIHTSISGSRARERLCSPLIFVDLAIKGFIRFNTS